MDWIDYYYLLLKYDGNLENVSKEELEWAREGNSNNPVDALNLAKEKYELYKKNKKEGNRNEL